jgi:aspartyl-tRNA(Asn)/glutamyl-tRNA(Gln) amidotransferase subunit C
MISRQDIENLAQLSRLKLDEQEADALQKDFAAILEYVGQIQAAAPVSESQAPAPEVRNVMREDVVGMTPGGSPEAILKQAPRREGDYFVVRKIIQKDEP